MASNKTLTLKEANYKIEQLDNEIKRLSNEIELLESSVGVKAINPDKLIVDGGKRVDKLLEFVSNGDLQSLKEKLILKKKEKNIYLNWIDKELKLLEKYDKKEQMIVYYKEHTLKHYTWYSISRLVNYSVPQSIRIYNNYLENKKNIEKLKDDNT